MRGRGISAAVFVVFVLGGVRQPQGVEKEAGGANKYECPDKCAHFSNLLLR